MYELRITPTAKKQLQHLPDRVVSAVRQSAATLCDQPRPVGTKKLADGMGWRIRIGEYRMIYTIDDAEHVVTIVAVKPRQSAYR